MNQDEKSGFERVQFSINREQALLGEEKCGCDDVNKEEIDEDERVGREKIFRDKQGSKAEVYYAKFGGARKTFEMTLLLNNLLVR